ncbi:MAG TPA: type III pantothenate kinase [Rhodocyclaceae bacterium]|nr:type III pantothenate kinase [Rhodocyclaceae bacterium]
MTLLCIDAGNTRGKWGLHTGHELVHGVGRGAVDRWLAQDTFDYAELGRDTLRARWATADRAVIANVAGAGVAQAIQHALAGLDMPVLTVQARRSQCGVRNDYERPEQLGADRWAALIGARRLHAGACLVVSVGTATTVDVLSERGVFLGGLILPGPQLMRASLSQRTADLPFSQGRYTDLPRNTDDAIASGCTHAQVGAIERMYTRVHGRPSALCLLTGGGAGEISAHLSIPHRPVPELVLEGLAALGATNPATAPSAGDQQ